MVWPLYRAGCRSSLGLHHSGIIAHHCFYNGKNLRHAQNHSRVASTFNRSSLSVFALASGASLHRALLALFARDPGAIAPVAIIALVALALLKFLYWRAIDAAPREHTMANATGLGANVRQWEVPHTTKNFVQREMGFVVARRHASRLRGLFFIVLICVGLLELAASLIPVLSFAGFVLMLIAAWVERWLFFAQGEHVITLFYGNAQA